MEAAAQQLHFEEAAQLRDQLAKLKAVQAQQIVTADADHDADVIAIAAGLVIGLSIWSRRGSYGPGERNPTAERSRPAADRHFPKARQRVRRGGAR